MKFLKVGYSRTFPLEQFGNHKPFVEVEVEIGDNPMEVLKSCQTFIQQFHEQALAEMEASKTTQIQTSKPVTKVTVFDEIANCKTIDELKGWELFAKSSKNVDVKLAYENKLKQLSK